MRFTLILLCWFIWQNPAKAQTTAQRPTLLIFSGSDWCLPCIQFEKTILSDSSFLDFVGQHLEFIQADFPQRARQSAELKKQNEILAERYNPEGTFPKILLLRPDRSVWAQIHWQNQSPQLFTQLLDNYLNPN